MAPQTNPTSVSNPSDRSPWVIIIVVVLIVLAVFISVWLRKNGVGGLPDTQENTSDQASEQQKQQLQDSLVRGLTATSSVTQAEQKQLVNSLSASAKAESSNPEEQKQLLESLKQSSR